MKFLEEIGSSFDTSPGGKSARKLSAFACMGAAFLVTIGIGVICAVNKDPAFLFYTFCVWMICGLIYLGMVTIPQLLMALKTVKGDNTTDTTTEIKSTTETHETN